MTGRHVPAHKVSGDAGKPGQVVYPSDITLNDYIKRKTEPGLALESGEFIFAQNIPPPKNTKLTFKEWWESPAGGWAYGMKVEENTVRDIWNAAQANK